MQGAWVISLDRELRSHMPCGVQGKGYYKYPKLRICFKNCGLFVRWHIKIRSETIFSNVSNIYDLLLSRKIFKSSFQNSTYGIIPVPLKKWTNKKDYSARLSSTYTKIGTIQRRLAWPLHKDDTQIREAFHILCHSPPSDTAGLTHTHTHKKSQTRLSH